MSGTVIAALIAATAALLVAVIERVLVHRSERREQRAGVRRDAYAQVLGDVLAFEAGVDTGRPEDELAVLARAAMASFATLSIVAPPIVDGAASVVSAALQSYEKAPNQRNEAALADARREFRRVARDDLRGNL